MRVTLRRENTYKGEQMSADSISSVSAATAETGSRGEREHVRGESFSVHTWDLANPFRSETHSNSYGHVSYVTEGELYVFDARGDVRTIAAGDTVYIPAGVDYSMEGKGGVKTVETRLY